MQTATASKTPSTRPTMKTRLAGLLERLAPSKVRVSGGSHLEAARRFARFYLRHIGGGWWALPEGGTVAQGAAALWDELEAQGWARSQDGGRHFVIAAPEQSAAAPAERYTIEFIDPQGKVWTRQVIDRQQATKYPGFNLDVARRVAGLASPVLTVRCDIRNEAGEVVDVIETPQGSKRLDPGAAAAAGDALLASLTQGAQQIGALIDSTLADLAQGGEAVHTVPAVPVAPLPAVPRLPRNLPGCAAVAQELRRNGRGEVADLMDAPLSSITRPRTIAAKVGRSSSELRELRREGKAALSITMVGLGALASGAPLPERIERRQVDRAPLDEDAQRRADLDNPAWWRGLKAALQHALGRELGEDEDLLNAWATWRCQLDENREAPIAAVLREQDPAALAVARFAYEESIRRGWLPDGVSLDAWLADAVFERAYHLVQVGIFEFQDTLYFKREAEMMGRDADHGMGRTTYFAC